MCVIRETMSGFICAECSDDCDCVVCELQPEFQVLAEGLEWEDSDGRTTWPYDEAQHVAQRVRDNGYDPVEVI